MKMLHKKGKNAPVVNQEPQRPVLIFD